MYLAFPDNFNVEFTAKQLLTLHGVSVVLCRGFAVYTHGVSIQTVETSVEVTAVDFDDQTSLRKRSPNESVNTETAVTVLTLRRVTSLYCETTLFGQPFQVLQCDTALRSTPLVAAFGSQGNMVWLQIA